MKPYRLYTQSFARFVKFKMGRPNIPHSYDELRDAIIAIKVCWELWPNRQFVILDCTDKGKGSIVANSYVDMSCSQVI